jgi:hypothetical protein
MSYPDGFVMYNAELWHLPPPEHNLFWRALVQASSPGACAWRQQVGLVGQFQVTKTLRARLCSAHWLFQVLEDLVDEGRLPRRQATRIEDLLLRELDRFGVWKSLPGPRVERPGHLKPYIRRLCDVGIP